MQGDSLDEQADALSRIESDDDDAERDAIAYAGESLINGQTFEQVMAALAGQGWDPERIEFITEAAAKATRRQRGILTRDDVAAMVSAKYTRANGGMTSFFRSGIGLFAIFGYLRHLRETIQLHRKLKHIGRK